MAVALLREALRDIGAELHAAGPDEVAQHPEYLRHARTATRIKKFLDAVDPT